MRTLHLLCGLIFAVAAMLGVILTQSAAVGAPDSSLAFKTAPGGEFTFDTGVLRGKLRPKGKCLGLAAVVHAPSGIALDRGEGGYGLLSHYRVFTANRRYGGGAWDWSSAASLRPDGAVEVIWATDPARPFDLRALYRWVSPDVCEVETIVTARQDISGFESFLASYFQNRFTNCMVYASQPPAGPGAARFVATDKAAGIWQMFPRDDAVLSLIKDGRWKLDPSPVDWTIRDKLGSPIGVRRDPVSGLTAALLASAEDCFAIAAPFETEGHYSIYLCQFGRNLKGGETARARGRLVISSEFSQQKIVEIQKTMSAGWAAK